MSFELSISWKQTVLLLSETERTSQYSSILTSVSLANSKTT